MVSDIYKVSISIHALLAESDKNQPGKSNKLNIFLSTLSLRRATTALAVLLMFNLYFYPRSPCGERQRLGLLGWLRVLISIHALLAESDNLRVLDGSKSSIISIHALLAESDCIMTITTCTASKFLSTLSLRRATNADLRRHRGNDDFYPRSPCGERPALAVLLMFNLYFYPRSPCGERRLSEVFFVSAFDISIHALLAESDQYGHCG